VREQRGLFHTLQNGSTTWRRERNDQENRGLRTHVREQAAAVSQAETASHARQRLTQWREPWRGLAPYSLATRERDSEQTLVFDQMVGLAPQWIRPTSL
jgi:hypothetical protein